MYIAALRSSSALCAGADYWRCDGSGTEKGSAPNMITLWHCVDARSFRALWALEEVGQPYRLEILPFPAAVPRARLPRGQSARHDPADDRRGDAHDRIRRHLPVSRRTLRRSAARRAAERAGLRRLSQRAPFRRGDADLSASRSCCATAVSSRPSAACRRRSTTMAAGRSAVSSASRA